MNKKRIIISSLFLIIIIFLFVFHKNPRIYKYSRMLIGTIINITIIADSESEAVNASEKAFAEIERIENLMSPYREGEIRNINIHAYDKSVKISAETFNLIEKAQYISGLTQGSFDITFASISKFWNYKDENFVLPDIDRLNEQLPAFNYRNIILDRSKKTIKFNNKNTKIELGGIAKGYAIKKGISSLKNSGINNAILEAGGDVQVLGDKFDKAWKIGLRHPRNDDLVLSIVLKDMDSIASSGDYERFRMYNGIRYHHILNPKTGFPARTFASVSIISKDPVKADAYATALFVMGKKRAVEFLKTRKDLKAIFIDLDLRLSASTGLKERIAVFGNEGIEWF